MTTPDDVDQNHINLAMLLEKVVKQTVDKFCESMPDERATEIAIAALGSVIAHHWCLLILRAGCPPEHVVNEVCAAMVQAPWGTTAHAELDEIMKQRNAS